MKAIRITDLDQLKDFPVQYILKADQLEEMVGCCPKSFFNFFGLLNCIEGLNSEFLLWLKMELEEDEETKLVMPKAIKKFCLNPIFEKLNCSGGLNFDHSYLDFLSCLNEGAILFSILIREGLENPSHCVIFQTKDKRLYCDGAEISIECFCQMIYCHKSNVFIIGDKKRGQ